MGKIADLFRVHTGDSIRLGIGERVDSQRLIAVWKARDAFFRAMQGQAPEAFDDLWQPEHHTLYHRWERRLLADIEARIEEQDGLSWEVAFTDPDFAPFTNALDDWAIRWNIRTAWVHQCASAYFLDEYLPDDDTDPSADGISSFVLENAELFPLFSAPGPRLYFAGEEYPPYGKPDTTYWPMNVFPDDPETGDDTADFDWNPAVESRKANEERAVEYFKARYRAAQDARLKEAEEQYPHKAGTRRYEHFVWLVQYQVLEWTYSEVARKANRSRQSVTEAIRDTAALVDLPLRTS